MAVTRNSNTLHAASGATGTLSVKNIRVSHIFYLAQGAASVATIQDVTTNVMKNQMEITSDNDFRLLDFSDNPLVFPNGINVATNTTMVVILTIQETQG